MEKDWLEQELANSLNAYESSLDLDAAWQRLEDARHPKKRRFLIWWFWGLNMAFLLLLGGLTCLYFRQLSVPDLGHFTIASKSKSIIHNNQTSTKTILENLDNNNTLNSNKAKTVAPFNKKNQSKRYENTSIATEIIKNNSYTNSNLKSSSPTKTQSKSYENHFLLKSYFKNISIPTKRLLPSLSGIVLSPSISFNSEPLLTPYIPFSITLNSRKNLIDNVLESHSTIYPISSFVIYDPINFLPTLEILPLLLPVAEPPVFNPQQLIPQHISTWSIGLQIAYGKHLSKLQTKLPELEDYIENRVQQEVPLDATSITFQIRKKLNKKCFVESGLNFDLAVTRFSDFHQETYTETLEEQIIEINEYLDGTTETITGEQTILVHKTIDKVAYQRLQQIRIPLLFGIEVPVFSRYAIIPSIGISFSPFIKQKGGVLAIDNTVSPYSDLHNLGYRKHGTWQSILRIEMSYQLQQNLQLNFGMQNVLQLNSGTISSTNFSSKNAFLQGNIGIYYTL